MIELHIGILLKVRKNRAKKKLKTEHLKKEYGQ